MKSRSGKEDLLQLLKKHFRFIHNSFLNTHKENLLELLKKLF